MTDSIKMEIVQLNALLNELEDSSEMDEGLWDNIHAKRKRGERPAKPGDDDYPKKKAWDKAVASSKNNESYTQVITSLLDEICYIQTGYGLIPEVKFEFNEKLNGKMSVDQLSEIANKALTEYYSLTENLSEAEYKGRKVKLNKITKGDRKKYKVHVKNDKGNVVKVEFGDPNMEIKRDDPKRRKNFRARHNCSEPGPKWKARYWACRTWSSTPVSKMV
jgi:hypothetical protein